MHPITLGPWATYELWTLMRPSWKVIMLSHGSEWPLSSTNSAFCSNPPLFQENTNFWNRMLEESMYKNLPIHLCSFLFVTMIRNAVQFSTLKWSWVFGFCSLPYHGEETVYSNDSGSYQGHPSWRSQWVGIRWKDHAQLGAVRWQPWL
jgi:hypothetical protein